MMRRQAWMIGLLVLAFLGPMSSKKPDAVQHVLGLSGGADSLLKGLSGIAAAAFIAMGLAYLLERWGKHS